MVRTLCIAASVMAFASGNALAEETHIHHIKVSLSDQQLNDRSQAKVVYAKLYKAAQAACESEGEGSAYRLADDRACEAEAMKAVLVRLDRQSHTQLSAQLAAADRQR